MELIPPMLPLEPAPSPGYSGTAAGILLVDSDPVFRTSVRDFLRTSGFQVLEARDSYDALFLIAQYGPNIRLLLTEINLLPVGGIKLAENVLRLWPHIQAICMSEPFDAPGIAHWMNYLGARFIRKPFTPVDLMECLQLVFGKENPMLHPIHFPGATGSQYWETPALPASGFAPDARIADPRLRTS